MQACVGRRGEMAEVRLTLLRRGKEQEVDIMVPLLGCDGAKRILCWHGLMLQETPRRVREFGPVPAGVYISQTLLGSPSETENIEGEFLISVDGIPTPTLDAVVSLGQARGETTPASHRG